MKKIERFVKKTIEKATGREQDFATGRGVAVRDSEGQIIRVNAPIEVVKQE